MKAWHDILVSELIMYSSFCQCFAQCWCMCVSPWTSIVTSLIRVKINAKARQVALVAEWMCGVDDAMWSLSGCTLTPKFGVGVWTQVCNLYWVRHHLSACPPEFNPTKHAFQSRIPQALWSTVDHFMIISNHGKYDLSLHVSSTLSGDLVCVLLEVWFVFDPCISIWILCPSTCWTRV